jgi:hypothetical protein
MPRLYAPQEPLIKNMETQLWEPNRRIDLTPAKRFGEITFVWPPGSAIWASYHVRNKALEIAKQYNDGEDFVINLGSPSLIGILCWAIGNVGKELRVLEWDRRINDYVPIYVKEGNER